MQIIILFCFLAWRIRAGEPRDKINSRNPRGKQKPDVRNALCALLSGVPYRSSTTPSFSSLWIFLKGYKPLALKELQRYSRDVRCGFYAFTFVLGIVISFLLRGELFRQTAVRRYSRCTMRSIVAPRLSSKMYTCTGNAQSSVSSVFSYKTATLARKDFISL